MNEKMGVIGMTRRIRSDHEWEFKNDDFVEFCNEEGIKHELLAPKTP